MAAGNAMDADGSRWVPWAINGQLQAGHRRASLASSGLQAGIAGWQRLHQAGRWRCLAGRGQDARGSDNWLRHSGSGGLVQTDVDGRASSGWTGEGWRWLVGSDADGHRGLQETLVADTDGPDGPAASQPAIDRPLTPSPSTSMGNSKLVPVAGLAITVRLSSHMMHATSSPTKITLHSALHG
ncbi:hypothetical protein ACLOJK_035125 [Asimina triloba]